MAYVVQQRFACRLSCLCERSGSDDARLNMGLFDRSIASATHLLPFCLRLRPASRAIMSLLIVHQLPCSQVAALCATAKQLVRPDQAVGGDRDRRLVRPRWRTAISGRSWRRAAGVAVEYVLDEFKNGRHTAWGRTVVMKDGEAKPLHCTHDDSAIPARYGYAVLECWYADQPRVSRPVQHAVPRE